MFFVTPTASWTCSRNFRDSTVMFNQFTILFCMGIAWLKFCFLCMDIYIYLQIVLVPGGKIMVMGYMIIARVEDENEQPPSLPRADVLPTERPILPQSSSMRDEHPPTMKRCQSEPKDIGSCVPLHPRLLLSDGRVHVRRKLAGGSSYSSLCNNKD